MEKKKENWKKKYEDLSKTLDSQQECWGTMLEDSMDDCYRLQMVVYELLEHVPDYNISRLLVELMKFREEKKEAEKKLVEGKLQ